jgi:DNA-binding CsgD family transcriptional regulator
MIRQKHINAERAHISSETPIIVLSDNYWLYFGVSQLLQRSNVIHVRLCDEEIYRKLWGNLKPVILIVDNDIFIQGEWLSILKIFEACTFLKIIWLKGDKTGAFIPLKPGKSYLVEKKKSLFEFKGSLNDIFYGHESRTAKTRCANLTKKEHYVIRYLAAEQNVQLISERASLSLKSIYNVRSTLMSKFGFDNACFFQYILFKNIDILLPFFANKAQAFNVRQIK